MTVWFRFKSNEEVSQKSQHCREMVAQNNTSEPINLYEVIESREGLFLKY